MEEVARRLKLTLPEAQRAALFLARSPAHLGAGDIGVMWDLRAVVPWTNQARGYLVMAHHDGHERWKSGSLPGSGRGPGHFPMIPT
jgi:hypothetical protein